MDRRNRRHRKRTIAKVETAMPPAGFPSFSDDDIDEDFAIDPDFDAVSIDELAACVGRARPVIADLDEE